MKVERAIILAAGLGSRMYPITNKIPKPLVKVGGQRIIDSLLDAIVAVDIPEIYIVRGYLAEQFDVLKRKYPKIHFIENPGYAEANNIFSLIQVGDLLKNSYIIEADLFLKNKKLIQKEQTTSNYLAIPVKETMDWCFQLGPDGVIKRVSIGGKNCWQMVGISYWTDADGAKLARHAKELYYTKCGKEKYWDQIALEAYCSEYELHVRKCEKQDVVEIDTFEELQKLDSSYRIDKSWRQDYE